MATMYLLFFHVGSTVLSKYIARELLFKWAGFLK